MTLACWRNQLRMKGIRIRFCWGKESRVQVQSRHNNKGSMISAPCPIDVFNGASAQHWYWNGFITSGLLLSVCQWRGTDSVGPDRQKGVNLTGQPAELAFFFVEKRPSLWKSYLVKILFVSLVWDKIHFEEKTRILSASLMPKNKQELPYQCFRVMF